MAGNNRIRFDVDFNVKQENLRSLQNDLQKIDELNRNQRYGQSGIWNIYDNQTEVIAYVKDIS